ncbi:MAG: hypothetical protein OEY01_10280 [Desulfobulbaceae bacterium]|nr:hypothetical protein [Desulfobulbaceae bacterium]
MIMTSPLVTQKTNKWFEDRRDFFVKNLYKGFYETFCRFHAILAQTADSRQVSFAEINHLVGTETQKGRLWKLKDRCHQLWRHADPAREINGCLLDWVLGSLFHESMKLKESIYMFQFYGPLAQAMIKQNQPETIKFCGMECHSFIESIGNDIKSQMENLLLMFTQAKSLLRTMLPELAGNLLLIRFLLENPEVAHSLWGESMEEIFADIFPDSPEYGFCAAARSYQEGNWFTMAHEAYGRALAINPTCLEAQGKIYQLQALAREHDLLCNRGPG